MPIFKIVVSSSKSVLCKHSYNQYSAFCFKSQFFKYTLSYLSFLCLQIDDSLSAVQVQRACSSTGTSSSLLSTVIFQTSITKMYFSNAKVDVVFALSEEHHFDDETFQGGRDVITTGTQQSSLSSQETCMKQKHAFFRPFPCVLYRLFCIKSLEI